MSITLQARTPFGSFQDSFPQLGQVGLKIAAILVVAIIANRLVRAVSRRIIKSVDDGDPTTMTAAEQRGHTLAQLLNSVGGASILVAAGLSILNLFVPIAPLLAGVGVAGLAISFGAQSLVKDIISGFFILMENQFAVGDVITVDGVSGLVERMTLRVVMLRDLNGVLHIVPNGSITRVSNRTRGWARSVVDVGVAYRENIERVLGVLREIASEMFADGRWKLDLTEEPAVLGVESLGDSAVILRVLATTRPGRQWEVSRELRRRIKNRFDERGISIPFPQRTLHLDGADRLLQLLGERQPTKDPPS